MRVYTRENLLFFLWKTQYTTVQYNNNTIKIKTKIRTMKGRWNWRGDYESDVMQDSVMTRSTDAGVCAA